MRLTRIGAALAAFTLSLGLVAVAAPANAGVSPTGKARGATTVTFTDVALGALGPLSPAAVTPGVLGADDSKVKASFPIVGNANDGVIKHVGGLSLNDGETFLSLTKYNIVVADGVLTADATVNGEYLGRINFLNVSLDANAAPGCSASAQLTLNADAAGALTALFGAGDLTGAPIGSACVAFR